MGPLLSPFLSIFLLVILFLLAFSSSFSSPFLPSLFFLVISLYFQSFFLIPMASHGCVVKIIGMAEVLSHPLLGLGPRLFLGLLPHHTPYFGLSLLILNARIGPCIV